MDLDGLMDIAMKWADERNITAMDLPPSARNITGNPKTDAQYYYFEEESGVRLNFFNNGKYKMVKAFEVVDEAKFIVFVLKWS